MSRTLGISLAVVVLLVGVAIGGAVAFRGSSAGTSSSGSSLVDEITSSPESYYGHRVRVRDSINHVYSANALTLGEGTQQGLLVVLESTHGKKPPAVDAYVLVTGVVQRFGPDAWRNWTGARSGRTGILSYYNGQPAIHATEIRRLR